MELEQLYESVFRLRERGAVANTYSGTGELDDSDGDALSELIEYIYVRHAQNRPD
ncbi:hypothetical protein [Flintibacter muris]|uniref:hypothetical protein n=1 Tax=Flintibacter muris TaxID=2941327 RepID=UPI00203D6D31|nr:hypothetical protein [Flintibacter muris]